MAGIMWQDCNLQTRERPGEPIELQDVILAAGFEWNDGDDDTDDTSMASQRDVDSLRKEQYMNMEED